MTIDLQVVSRENLLFILDKMAEKLAAANRLIFDEKFYSLDQYDDLKFLYDHIMKFDKLSAAEVEAFVNELQLIRKK